jgi:predicted metalloprotease
MVVVLALIGWALGIDPRTLIGDAEMLLGGGEQQQTSASSTTSSGNPSDEMGRFVSAVLGSTETVWTGIAHEIGHHVQNLLGVLPKVQQAQRAVDQTEANGLQVRVELQADCLAGVWANRAQAKWDFIEPGDVDAALQTASAIGDDRLQRRSQGYVVPDAFTHGTSAQRSQWFTTGLKSGTVASCNTFRNEQF